MAKDDIKLAWAVIKLSESVVQLRRMVQIERWMRKNPDLYYDEEFTDAWNKNGEALDEAIESMKAWLDANRS